MGIKRNSMRAALLASSMLASSLAVGVGPVAAQDKSYRLDLPAQSLSQALMAFGTTTDQQIVFSQSVVQGRAAPALQGDYTASQALAMLLAGSGLVAERNADGVVMIRKAAQDPQPGSAAGDGAEVEALIVTAQKREEDIQDVPIAISAFTQEALEQQKIEGGFDLLKAIPNVTFSKNNFTSYNFSIRGIGTKAVSATTDPGVAVSFNNIALLQNRLFEQEYFDIERVEVLRGPQGTLYGRNATAGVVNVISAKPDLDEFDAWVKGEIGNYSARRVSAMVNVPLLEDRLAVRLAGAFTSREGYDFNQGTGNNINGRELWSGRLTVGFEPVESISANLIWEHFDEDDNRSRTGKQLCHRDPGPTMVGNTLLVSPGNPQFSQLLRATFSQGCKAGSLYAPEAFGTPNGLALPFVYGMLFFGEGGLTSQNTYGPGPATLLKFKDPYGGKMQSSDMRTINSINDPAYRAKADVVELNLQWDITDSLTFSSQTAWNKDETYSFQDFNRFNTESVFADTSGFLLGPENGFFQTLAPDGVFCDPQLGCSDQLVGFDIAQASGEQFTQELRLQSDFDQPVNFSVGANFTRFKTIVDYYLFYNLITAYAMVTPFQETLPGQNANIERCYAGVNLLPTDVPYGTPGSACPYIDPNPIGSIDGEGHNYFRSKNPYKLKSWAAFGELYWNLAPEMKVTAGLRYTRDDKSFIPVPTQVLLAEGLFAGGTVNRGYPELPPIEQEWGEWTGRLGVDWKPDLGFTDQTLLYAFYSHGYKAGGANPPTPGFSTELLTNMYERLLGEPAWWASDPRFVGRFEKPILQLTGVDYEPTFEPEFVDAFEVGAKNTLLDGALTLNTTGFFYDYKDYQVSQIKNRTAVNENFDAQSWGLELESVFAPTRNLQLIANIGYLDTKIAEGESSIDIMNRTQGHPGLVVAKPWVQLPSNCVVPVEVVESWYQNASRGLIASQLCGGTNTMLDVQIAVGTSSGPIIDPNTGAMYDPLYHNGQNGTIDINGGAGIRAQLGGNELPNAPHWTMNLGAQYAIQVSDAWKATVRGDVYWQSQSWARVYNLDPYDKLHGWYNLNLSVWLENDNGLKVEFYAKNILDKTPITDAFLNSDDTALTTNVFTLDPRLIGLSVRKEF